MVHIKSTKLGHGILFASTDVIHPFTIALDYHTSPPAWSGSIS
jgi:hypothetical protein